MSSKKEEKSQDTADKIKAATLSAAKGLSRAQAERAAAAAARNVNAYGQKEEGPSGWQERKEAKRQMYLMSTEKAVRLGERKDLKMYNISGTAAQCQKCFQAGHWTYECKNERGYISRPSRSQQLKNPKLDDADVRKEQSPDKEEGEKRGKKSKRKHRSDKESDSDSEASVFDSQSGSSSAAASDYSSEESASSESSSSDSEEEKRRRTKRNKNKKQKKGRKKRYSSSSSESSDYESNMDSDSDDKSRRRKSKSRSQRHYALVLLD